MVNLRLDREGGADRARRDPRGAPLAHREQSRRRILDEQMNAALYQTIPTASRSSAGSTRWRSSRREDAIELLQALLRAQQRHPRRRRRRHAPTRCKTLAEATYGKIPANPADHRRAQAPAGAAASRRAPRRATRTRAPATPRCHRDYLAPSYTTAEPGEAEALDLLMKIAADGATSRLYKKLVVEEKIASSAGGCYSGSGLDSGTHRRSTRSPPTASALDKIEAAHRRGPRRAARRTASPPAELERAKTSYIAEYIYENDNQASLARRYGWGLAVGRTIEQIDGWPDAISKVTARRREEGRRNLPRSPPLGDRHAAPRGRTATPTRAPSAGRHEPRREVLR